MNKNDKRLLKYRAIVNATGDAKLARQARSWSEQRIEETYGITLPNKIPKLKEYAESTIKRKQRQVRKYQYAKQRGLTQEEIQALDRLTFKEIEEATTFKVVYERPMDIIKKFADRKSLQDNWKSWAMDEDLPREIKELAYKINNDKGYDENNRYGFAVVFYSYTRRETVKSVMENVQVDPFDGNRYVAVFG